MTASVSSGLGFCFPVRELSNERLKLTPFRASIHSSPFFAASSAYPELWAHVPIGPFETEQEFNTDFLRTIDHPDPGMMFFAIIDKTKPSSAADEEGALAGIVCYMGASPANLCVEIAIVVLPPFQRTHVTSNAVGLLLEYALELPSQGGLGLRRVQWLCSSMNASSIRAAERMGFKKEGVMKWHCVYHRGKEMGKVHNGREFPPRDGHGEQDYARDTVVLSHCWDDWEQGWRENIQAVMDRRD
ncbi:acetyltransferase [Rhizopogon salebrosus TDB-379]|nr:acetyltransferase [Rhizopogon salebrosus TDB-379]